MKRLTAHWVGKAEGDWIVAREAALRETVDELKRSQQKTAAALQFAFRNCSLAREEQQRAVAAEAQVRRRLAQARELARAVLFDLPDKLNETPGAAPARAFLVRTALAYLDGLAGEVGAAAVLSRELAVAYGRVGDVLGGPHQGNGGDAAAALASHRKSLEIFTALAGALPGDAQAQRDLTLSGGKVADLERSLDLARPNGRAAQD